MARTRAVDHDEKREAILRRSAGVIAERGVDRASMAQIAAECGVSKALLYHYYENKDELVFDIVREHLETLEAALDEADDPGLHPDQRLRRLVHATLETYRDSDDQHKIQLGAMPTLPPDRAEALREIERRIVRRFAVVLRLVNPALEGRRPLLTPVTMSLFGMINWVYLWFRPDGPISRAEYADLATQLILEGAKSVR
jgi:AcrR family transcriptional regulator